MTAVIIINIGVITVMFLKDEIFLQWGVGISLAILFLDNTIC